ncbi:hypothetical protein D3C72_1217700 [compost metagenome]
MQVFRRARQVAFPRHGGKGADVLQVHGAVLRGKRVSIIKDAYKPNFNFSLDSWGRLRQSHADAGDGKRRTASDERQAMHDKSCPAKHTKADKKCLWRHTVDGDIRFRHRGRGLGRLRAGQPPQPGPGHESAAAGSRGPRQLPLDPHPRGLPVLHRQPPHRLDVPHGQGSRAGRAFLDLSARPGAGRMLVDQRHDLHARPA